MQQPKILVADDSRTIRALLRRTLFAAGFDVILASDGLEAVRSARRDHPDLVILDIQMPEMDGYTACEEILEMSKRDGHPPIIFLTQETARHLTALGSQLGAYLPKPVDEGLLLETICRLLPPAGTPQATLTGDHPPAPVADAPPVSGAPRC